MYRIGRDYFFSYGKTRLLGKGIQIYRPVKVFIEEVLGSRNGQMPYTRL